MRLIIGGKTIELSDKETTAANVIVRWFINSVKKSAFDGNKPSLFFTVLIVMHLQSQALIDALSPESLRILMKAANGNKK